jgi:hypothetical protein
MKKYLVFVVFLGFFSSSILAGSASDSWFKCFKGNLGTFKIVMYMFRFEDKASGYYYYENEIYPLKIFGDFKKDSLSLISSGDGVHSDYFNGVLRAGKYSGKKSENEEIIEVQFELTEDREISKLFDFEYISDEIRLIKNYDKSPTARYAEGTIWPEKNNSNYDYLSKVIADEKKMDMNSHSVAWNMKNDMKAYFKSYVEDYSDVTIEMLKKEKYTSSYNMEEEDLLTTPYFDENIFVVSRSYYAFTGGAHGNYGTGFSNYDLKNKRKLALDDIINSEGKAALPKLLEQYFRIGYQVESEKSLMEWGLFTDTISVNDNFCITPGCLAFCYVPYEIGPYAMGEAFIFIPNKEIEKYMTPWAKTFFRK